MGIQSANPTRLWVEKGRLCMDISGTIYRYSSSDFYPISDTNDFEFICLPLKFSQADPHIKNQRFDTFQDEGGTPYAKDDLKTLLLDFFVDASLGGGFFIPDSATTPFASIADRDTWARANLTDLIQNTSVVAVDGTPYDWYLWNDETPKTVAEYNTAIGAGAWVDGGFVVRGEKGDKGDTGAQGADGADGGGGIVFETVLRASDFGAQNPTGLGIANATTVTFGASQVATNISVVNGEIELLSAGLQHQCIVTLRVQRDALPSGVADLHAWLEFDLSGSSGYTAVGQTRTLELSEQDLESVVQQFTFVIDTSVPVNSKWRVRIGRGDTSANTGGLIGHDPEGSFSALPDTPSADIQIQEIAGGTDSNIPVIQSLRGGPEPAEHTQTSSYNKGDRVHVTANNRSYEANQNISPEPFDITKWNELSIFALDDRIVALDDEQITQNDELERLRGSDVYPDYDPANSTPYPIGTILHDSTGTGKNYRAKIEIPANDGTFDENDATKWDEVSIEENNNPNKLARRLEELTGNDKLDSNAISYLERFQTVYVSQSGVDTNDGRGVDSPVLTLAQANTVADTLPNTTNRVIVCLDGSVFTENFTPGNNTHVYMPWATLNGDFTSGNLSLDEYTFAEVTGTITVGKDDIINIGLLNGDIDFDNSTANQCVVNVNIHQSGNVTIPAGAGGIIRMNINTVGTGTYTDNSGGSVSIRGYYGARDLNDVIETQTIYVSNSGKSNGIGRTPNEAVDTIAQAIVLAGVLPITSKRIIKCIDASVFTGNITLLLPIDVEMPYATVTGNVNNTTASRCEINIGALIGNPTISNGSHYDIGQLVGDLTIGDCSTAAAYIRIKDYNSGTFDDSSAAGDVYFNIIHDSVGVVPTPSTGYNPYGQIGDVSYQSNSGGGAGFIPDIATLTSLGGSSTGWYNLITWDAVTAPDTSHLDLDLHMINSTGDGVITFSIQGTVVRGVADSNSNNSISLTQVIEESGNVLADTQFRFVRADATDVNSALYFQMNFDSGLTWSGTLMSKLNVNYGSAVNFGAGTLYTDVAGQEIVAEIDTLGWRALGVTSGSTGGLATPNVGSHNNDIAYIDFQDETVDIHAEETIIGKFSKIGTRLSAGEYGSWVAPTSTDWPIDAVFWTNLIAQQRVTVDDTTLNPSSTITLSAVDAGGTNAATMTGFDAAHRGLRFTTTSGTRGIAITFANCLFQRIQFTMNFGTATSSGGTTQDYEIVDIDGNQLMSFDIPASNNEPGDVNTFVFEFTSSNGDAVIYLRKRSTGTSQTVYLFNYGMTVNVDEPALEDRVVLQLDSPLRGFLLPRILPSSGAPVGSVALDGLAGNRPIWSDGNEWAYLNTTRISNTNVTGQFFFAEGNTFNESGWTGSNHQRLVPIQNHQGFPNLIRCTQSGGTITIQGPGNTQAFWDTARANGFRTDFRMMFGATFDGSVWMDIEPNNTSWGSNGRFEFNVTSNAGQLQITMINSGGNTTFDIDRDIMHSISMICAPNSDVAEIHIEGEKIGEVTYGGGGTTNRGTFFYIPPGNSVNDFSFQSIMTSALEAVELDLTLDANAIKTGLRHNIPNISSPVIRRIPKGLYNFGNTFTIVNGSTAIATVMGQDDDHQLIGGVSSYEVAPQKEVTFTQSASPLGTVWAVEGGKTIINHNENTSTGNSLFLTVDSAGTVTGRHGTYLGDLAVSRITTGQYSITAGSKVWGNEMTIIATPFGTAPREIAAGVGGLGQGFVNTFDAAGNPLSDAFYCAIYW